MALSGNETRKQTKVRRPFLLAQSDCEYVPALPARVVRQVLNDPRKIPYLLIWQDASDGDIKEAVRVRRYIPPSQHPPDSEMVDVKRTDGSLLLLRYVCRRLPRGNGRDLFLMCWRCARLRRMLYAWEARGPYTTSARTTDWQCRTCAGLRYASEGGALVLRSRGSWFRALEMHSRMTRSDRPDSWYPYVFSSPADAAAAGFCT